ncbi:MAG TPA: hypothetical protein VG097_03550 [Gemmata sp.]|nr:hypothetical protein [Gemmata sp.]
MIHFTRAFVVFIVFAAGVASVGTYAPAQDAKATVAKQKEAVVANLKKADLSKANIVETDNFFLVGVMPEEKAKALGTLLEKVVPVARKGLHYEAKEETWKGKLAVYYLPETRDFKSLIRTTFMMKPEGIYYDVRSDTPLVVDPVEVSGKATEGELFSNTAMNVASAYLKARGSTANIPSWLLNGFGRVTALRSEGLNSTRYQSFKKQAKVVASGKGNPPVAIADLWAENKPANADVLSASFVEYMAYGPGAENFIKLVYGFRPDENGNPTSVAQAFEAAGWKDTAALEKLWQKWVATGK